MDRQEFDRFYHSLDRSLFIENENKSYAHYDEALSIGHGQTISQPSLVYSMTEQLSPDRSSKVLEIGTGSGYQTAILAQLSKEVYTVERIDELSVKAQERLNRMGFSNIHYKIGDGSEGWPEHAPYDRIIVTAAAGKMPRLLVDQLAHGGRLLVPVGEMGRQELMLVARDENGHIQEKSLGIVRFVEFRGQYGWQQ